MQAACWHGARGEPAQLTCSWGSQLGQTDAAIDSLMGRCASFSLRQLRVACGLAQLGALKLVFSGVCPFGCYTKVSY